MGKYTPVLPEANVQYDYRWEIFGAADYTRFLAGPLLPKTNLYGFDVEGARFFNSHWAAVASGRRYTGTTGVRANNDGIVDPSTGEYLFLVGPEYRRVRNEHLSLNLHALVGGAYGIFDSDIKIDGQPVNPEAFGLFKNQLSVAGAFGGAVDFNLSNRWAVRISPEATVTDYQVSYKNSSLDAHYAATAGVVYRLRQGLRR